MMRKRTRTWTYLLIVVLGSSASAVAQDTFRVMLKVCSPLTAILGIIGIAVAGYLSGKSFDSYTGWERFTHGAGMFFNRKPFRRDRPTYGVTEEARRLNYEDSLFTRFRTILSLMHPHDGAPPKWVPDMGVEKLPEPFKSFFLANPKKYEITLRIFPRIDEQRAKWGMFDAQLALADAWSNAVAGSFEDHEGEFTFQHLFPPEPTGPPEEWDFRGIRREKPMRFKSPKHASELIKKVTHTFGATLVGITKLNPHWCYQGRLRGVGEVKYAKPAHWEYAIVFATPHEWDQLYSVPAYGTSYDAYSRERMIAGNLEIFLHELGYPARCHVPPSFFDVVLPPIAIDAGLGEVGRNGLVITPELGPNARLACVTTNVPMEVDKPIDIGVAKFCAKCKICADKCPSGSISSKSEPGVVRGYKRWAINQESCFHTWASVANSHPKGCRICLAVCPYTRKNNWMHSLSRNIEPRDPTGITASILLWMQKKFFEYPENTEFLAPPAGRNATYHEPPDWLQTEKWFDVEKTW
jgi:reductive dehalogenase